jgi:hypothetical protein
MARNHEVLSAALPLDLAAKIRAKAEADDRTVSQTIKRALVASFSNDES